MEKNMKFLLAAVNAKYIHSNPALYSLKAYAGEKYKNQIEIAEYTINQYARDILADIYLRKPDVVGFSCYIWNFEIIGKLLPELKKVLPDTKIWLGGPEVSFDADKLLLKYTSLTGIMIGEGEETFKELMGYYNGEILRLEDIDGLCLRSGFTRPRQLTDMSKLPFLYDDISLFENKIIYYESSRGCPYSCSYCLSSIDKKVRLRDTDIVKKELKFFLDNDVKQVKFVDRTFNCNREHTRQIWNFIKDNDNGITNFHFEVSADILNDEEIRILNSMRPGLVQLEIGVQSTNESTIRAINRVMDVFHLAEIVNRIKMGNNVHVHLDLIAGLPYEDYDTFAKSFDRVYAMKPDELQLGFLKVLKGSPMEQKTKEYGIMYNDNPTYEVLSTKWLSYGDVLKLKAVEDVVEIFYNSRQFTNTIAYMEKQFDSAFRMYELMAKYFAENQSQIKSPARVKRYEALLSFLSVYDSEKMEVYQELLKYDLYLREKAKSRPSFAGELDKEAVRDFYMTEEKERKYLENYKGYDWKQMSKMTHYEEFYYGKIVNDSIEWCSEKQNEKIRVLFDYRKRDALNCEARTYLV